MDNEKIAPLGGEVLIYQTEDGGVKLDVRLENETLWMTQSDMATLFQCSQDNVSLHLKNIYGEGELSQSPTTEDFSVVRLEGTRSVRRKLTFYNLDVVISVGYRVKSLIATRFRMWATERLKEYIVKGFTMDDRRLKEPDGGRYFEELLARIRDIRSSEKIFWRKILDIYATSVDYDPKAEGSKLFFKQVQNKMHWAAHGHTAAELICARANADEPNMGVTNYPGNKLLRRDAEVAKNYLGEDELNILNRIVTAYLEVAELQAISHRSMTMQEWIDRLNQFLTMTGQELLTHAGKVSHEVAMTKAHTEYERYRVAQRAVPAEVEQHFIEAEQELNRIQSTRKKGSD